MDFEKWMEENFDEPEWDEGYTRADMKKAYEATLDLLTRAKNHLEYCGFGDSWERECSKDLQKDLNEFFSK